MSSSKKRKLSDSSGSALDPLTQLQSLHSSVVASGFDAMPATALADQLKSVIAALESKADSPPPLSFSNADYKALRRFNIVRKGILCLYSDARLHDAVATSQTVGSEKLWSNDNMYKHLTFLANSFTVKNETSSRMIIDTFFFRSAAMVPPSQTVVVMLENHVSPVHLGPLNERVSGIVDYAAIVASSTLTRDYILIPPMLDEHYGEEMTAFFVAEAKASAKTASLMDHLPQVVLELVACAKNLGKSHIRGALTTGTQWHFVVVDLDANSNGANYWVSKLIEWKPKWSSTPSEQLIERTSNRSDPAVIAGILSSWIPESLAEFNGDKWFYQEPREV